MSLTFWPQGNLSNLLMTCSFGFKVFWTDFHCFFCCLLCVVSTQSCVLTNFCNSARSCNHSGVSCQRPPATEALPAAWCPYKWLAVFPWHHTMVVSEIRIHHCGLPSCGCVFCSAGVRLRSGSQLRCWYSRIVRDLSDWLVWPCAVCGADFSWGWKPGELVGCYILWIALSLSHQGLCVHGVFCVNGSYCSCQIETWLTLLQHYYQSIIWHNFIHLFICSFTISFIYWFCNYSNFALKKRKKVRMHVLWYPSLCSLPVLFLNNFFRGLKNNFF